MGYIIRMPKLGMEMEEGTLLLWEVDVEESVVDEQVIAEIESEKTTAEVTAREPGVLHRQYISEGETVSTGTPIGIIAGEDEDITDLEAEAEETLPSGPSATEETHTETGEKVEVESAVSAAPDARDTADAAAADDHEDTAETGGGESAGGTGGKATPSARQRAAELDVDLADIGGTGYQGAVTAEDVDEAASNAPPADAARTIRETHQFSGIRQTIADRLSASYRDAVHVTVHRDIQVDELMAAKEHIETATDTDGAVTLTDLLIRAVSLTLADYPQFNATVEDDTLTTYREHNIGVAVDTEDGLIVPVLEDVASRSIEDIASARATLMNDAVTGELSVPDLEGGTFTISNLGPFGVDSFTPIINPPQVAILGVNRIRDEPEIVNGGLSSKQIMGFDLSFDHRAVDGADAARFLDTLSTYLQDPSVLVSEFDKDQSVATTSRISKTDRRVGVRIDDESAVASWNDVEWEVTASLGQESARTPPAPIDQFLGSVAACIGLSVKTLAQNREIELLGLEVAVEGWPKQGSLTKIHAGVTVDAGAPAEVIDALITDGGEACDLRSLLGENTLLIERNSPPKE